MTFYRALRARRDDELGNLRREKTFQVSDTFDFGNLLGHPLFEGAVPCLKIGCLCRYSIVCLSQIGGAGGPRIEQTPLLRRGSLPVRGGGPQVYVLFSVTLGTPSV